MGLDEQAIKTALETSASSLREGTGLGRTEVRICGKTTFIPSVEIQERTVLTHGKRLKMAAVHDEDLVEGDIVPDPGPFISQLKQSELTADIFTFAQKVPDSTPRYSYRMEWDNFAVITITTFSNWWSKEVEPSIRRAVRKAVKSGVVVRRAELDDALVSGIVEINNETPVRQGKAFWHYQKDFADVKHEHSTYPDRSLFLGAYLGDELIGYMRLVRVGNVANVLEVLSKTCHFDKRPANALISKAVEVCEQEGMSHLVYCNYTYKDPNSSLTEFKKRNAFKKVLVPRYYVPLTLKGKIALQLRLHRGLSDRIPQPLVSWLLKIRSAWYSRRLKPATGNV